jgi:hypothetical protein
MTQTKRKTGPLKQNTFIPGIPGRQEKPAKQKQLTFSFGGQVFKTRQPVTPPRLRQLSLL